MKPPPVFLALTLLFWLGIYTLRSYVPAAVWNLADELPLSMKSVLAVGTNLVALAGLLALRKDHRPLLLSLACALGVVASTAQAFNDHDRIGPWLALLGWVLFVWVLGATARAITTLREERWVAPALAGALMLQVGLQSAGHGLDVPGTRGLIPIAVVVAISILLCLALQQLPAGGAEQRAGSSAVWLLFGPALFLAVTLGSHVGRLSQLSGLSFPLAALLIQATLFAALLLAGRALPFALRVACIAAAAGAAVFATRLQGGWALLLLVIPFVIIIALGNLAERRIRWSAAVSVAITVALFFALLFGFYYSYEFTPLWPLALIPVLVASALPLRARFVGRAPLLLPAVIALLATLLFFLPPQQPPVAADHETIAVLSYNIHQGFDDDGMPGMQRIAQQIAAANADIVALQETGRGWTLLGGNDLIAYLRWRFPEYEVVFQPINGQLWGNAIMSRLPLSVATGGSFDAQPGVFRYGWIQALIHLPDRHFEFYSVHLTADIEARGGDPRWPQARRLVERVAEAPVVIVAGDFNALPDETPVQTMTAALTDLGAETGLGTLPTWPAGVAADQRLDYIFGRGVHGLRGQVVQSTASDHRPVLIQVHIDDATAADTASSNRRSR